jgi:hypothetical protein
MSNQFVINVKVIVSVVASIMSIVITIMISDYVSSERKFKEEIQDDIKQMNGFLQDIHTDSAIQTEKLRGLEHATSKNSRDIENMKYTLYRNGMPIIKEHIEDGR